MAIGEQKRVAGFAGHGVAAGEEREGGLVGRGEMGLGRRERKRNENGD